MNIQESYFSKELKNNLNLYLDKSSNTINLTTLAESYIYEHSVNESDEEEVFEAVIDWFENWPYKSQFNN